MVRQIELLIPKIIATIDHQLAVLPDDNCRGLLVGGMIAEFDDPIAILFEDFYWLWILTPFTLALSYRRILVTSEVRRQRFELAI